MKAYCNVCQEMKELVTCVGVHNARYWGCPVCRAYPDAHYAPAPDSPIVARSRHCSFCDKEVELILIDKGRVYWACPICEREVKSPLADDPIVVSDKCSFTAEDLEIELAADDAVQKVIRLDRGKRYGSGRDVLANVRQADPYGGWRAAYISAFECLMRIQKHFPKAPNDIDSKDFDNAADDLINYSRYIKVLRRGEM